MRIGSTTINNIKIGSTTITKIIQNGVTYWDTGAPTTTAVYTPSYYVSNAGSDSANGLTPATAWATLTKVNTTNLQPGVVVAFRAGDTWRGELEIQQGSAGTGNRITYTRYGTGANPRILGSVKASNWTATAYANKWVSATNVPINPDGYAPGYSASGNIYFEVPGTYTRWGWFRAYTSNLSNLTQEYDWTWNNGTLYVYSPTDPDTRYTSVEAGQETFCSTTPNDEASYFTVDGIDLLYAKCSGYHAGYPEAAGQTDVTFRNCYIGYIGAKGQAAAYGIEVYHTNLLIENCTITDCGRRGISYNFYNATNVGTMTNVIIRNNVFKRGQHTTSLDLAWAVSDDMADVIGIYFYNNIVDDSDVEMRGDDEFSNQIYIEGWSTNTYDLYIVNNIFIKATARNILISGANNPHIWNNTIYGHNIRQIPNPYANVSFNSNTVNKLINIDFRNNIVHNDLSINTLDSYGLFAEHAPTTFQYIDYNLYWQDEVETDKAIIGYHGDYYNRNQWATWRSDYPAFDSHSPTPAEPQFTNKTNFDLTLSSTSPARGAGAVLPLISVTDAHGHTEIINQYDFAGNLRSTTNPSIGAYEYGSVATTTTAAPTTTSAPVGANIIADHTSVAAYANIPQFYIDEVKKMWVSIPGESHSEAYRVGCQLLETADPTYAVYVQESGTPAAYTTSNLRISRATWGSYGADSTWIYDYGEEDWFTNATALARTKAGLSYCNTNGPALSAIGFGWCWDANDTVALSGSYDPVYHTRWSGVSVNGPQGSRAWGLDAGDQAITGNSVSMDTYLNATEEYITHCTTNNIPTKIMYTTGPIDNEYSFGIGEQGYQRYLKYQHIRNFVNSLSGRYLFDYADILSYNDAGVLSTTTWTDNSGTLRTFPVIHNDNLGGSYVGHIGSVGALRLGKALWWLLARMAGWNGVAAADSVAPSVTSFVIPSTSTSLTVPISSFTATDAIGVTGFLITETSSTPSAGSGPWTGSAPTTYTFSSTGVKTLYAWAKDAAGNVSTSLNDSVTVTDITAPTISAVTSSNVTNTTATITWTTNEGATSVVEYGLTTGYGSTQSLGTYVTSHSINLTGLTLNTTYHYRVTSVDAATNSSTSADYTFTTTATAYGTEYTLVYNAMATKPTSTYADAQNTLVSTLVTAGIWAKLDLFYLFAQNNTANAALNWVAPTGDDNITTSGTPTFTAYQGYTGANNAYLNTNWNPSTENVNYLQNSASVFYYSRSNSTGTPCAFGSYQTGVAGIYDVSTRNGSISYQQLNSIGTNNVTATFGASGFYVYNRSASSGFNLYQNNVDIGSSTFSYTSSGLPGLNLYVLAANEDGTANNFWLGQMSAFGCGSSLTNTERTTLQNAIEAYMDTLGAGVI